MPKRTNPPDSTLRNVRANKKRDDGQDGEIAVLERRVEFLEDAVRTLQEQRASLEAKFDAHKSKS